MRCVLSCLLVLAITLALAFPQTHHSGGGNDGQFNPYVTEDRQGGFYLSYVERKAGRSDIMICHWQEGKDLSDPVRVSDLPGDAVVRNENPPKVAVTERGVVLVCWANQSSFGEGNIRFASSSDSGRTFSKAITVNSRITGTSPGRAFQSLAVDAVGRVFVAWIDERDKKETDRGAEIWMASSADNGRTFGPDRAILRDVCECCRATLQMDSHGRIYVSYRKVPPTGPMSRDIVVARSDDGGKAFVPTVVSRDGWEVNGCPVAGPSLWIAPSDRIVVGWFTGSGGRSQLYFSTSEDYGISFAPRKPVAPGTDSGKHVAVSVGSGGQIALIWEESATRFSCGWGFLHERGSIKKQGIWPGASYPVISVGSTRIAIAAAFSESLAVSLRVEPMH
jgi:hypothetical protein